MEIGISKIRPWTFWKRKEVTTLDGLASAYAGGSISNWLKDNREILDLKEKYRKRYTKVKEKVKGII